MSSPQHIHPFLKHPMLVSGIAALSCALCYFLSMTTPVLRELFVYAATLPLFVVALSLGLRPVFLSSVMALLGISVMGSFDLCLHFILTVPAAVIWYAYVRSSANPFPHKILMGWMGLGLVSIVLSVLDRTMMDTLVKAVELFYQTQLNNPELANLMASKEDFLRAIRVMPALLAMLWLGALSLSLLIANWLVRNPLGIKNLKGLKLYSSLPEGCFYLTIIGVLGCMLSDQNAKLLFVNLLVFSLFPFMSLGNDQLVAWMKGLPSPRIWLTVFYILCFLMMWPLLLMSFIGLGRFFQSYVFPFKRHKITKS